MIARGIVWEKIMLPLRQVCDKRTTSQVSILLRKKTTAYDIPDDEEWTDDFFGGRDGVLRSREVAKWFDRRSTRARFMSIKTIIRFSFVLFPARSCASEARDEKIQRNLNNDTTDLLISFGTVVPLCIYLLATSHDYKM